MDYEKLVSNLEEIASSAGEATLKYFRNDTAVSFKADGSPVTKADLCAEKLIIERLQELYPHIPAVGEESGGTPQEKSFWLIDPLDGTKEFVAGRDEYTVNIALVESGAPTAGAVYAPARALMYAGSVRTGAFRIVDGEKKRLPLKEREDLVMAVSRSHESPRELSFYTALETKAAERGLKRSRLVLGSSLKLCMIAEGEASVYLRAGPTMFWDTAAAHAIIRGAGGAVYEGIYFNNAWKIGGELSYLGKNMRNPPFIALLPKWEAFVREN